MFNCMIPRYMIFVLFFLTILIFYRLISIKFLR